MKLHNHKELAFCHDAAQVHRPGGSTLKGGQAKSEQYYLDNHLHRLGSTLYSYRKAWVGLKTGQAMAWAAWAGSARHGPNGSYTSIRYDCSWSLASGWSSRSRKNTQHREAGSQLKRLCNV